MVFSKVEPKNVNMKSIVIFWYYYVASVIQMTSLGQIKGGIMPLMKVKVPKVSGPYCWYT